MEVFWGYGLYPDRIGNFVAKPMDGCSGGDILRELCGHLRFDMDTTAEAICIPCRMPYITSMFMPRMRSEYSIRAAQMAVYSLLTIDKPIPIVTPHDRSFRTRFDALVKAFE